MYLITTTLEFHRTEISSNNDVNDYDKKELKYYLNRIKGFPFPQIFNHLTTTGYVIVIFLTSLS